MNAHTPGPWEAFKAHDGKFLIHRRDSGYKSLIGFTASSDSLGHGGSEEANARLIASAPDLLAALKEASAFLPGKENGDRNNLTTVTGRVFAAIASAEGVK